MSSPDVSVVVVPRERFRLASASLDSLLATTSSPFTLIYVDGGSPREVREAIQATAKGFGFRVIRTDHYLTPNQARNLALREVQTPYVVFVDNDVFFEPGWLEALVRCAEETGADLVTPLIGIGDPAAPRIHFAGGAVEFEQDDGETRFIDTHLHADETVARTRGNLVRSETDCVEFHCVLARTDALRAIGPLDEKLKATSEHLDLSLAIRRAGGRIYFEPGAVATYAVNTPLAWRELPYFYLRWSADWALTSERHFHQKWGFAFDDRVLRNFVRPHWRNGIRPIYATLVKVVGWRLSQIAVRVFARLFALIGRLNYRETPARPA